MRIILNNRNEEINQDNINVEKLLASKNFTFKMLVIKLNNTLIKKEQYSHTLIKDGDKIDILHLISGG